MTTGLDYFYGQARRFPRLTDEEVTALAKAGTPAAKKRLVECNLRIILVVIRQHVRRCHRTQPADLYQEGWFGLRLAAEKFDWRRGNGFYAFAYPIVERRILKALAKSERLLSGGAPAVLSLDDDKMPPFPDPESEILTASGAEDHAQKEVLQKIIARAFLNQRELAIVRYCFENAGTTFEELGRVHGVSPSRARQLKELALAKLRGAAYRLGYLRRDLF